METSQADSSMEPKQPTLDDLSQPQGHLSSIAIQEETFFKRLTRSSAFWVFLVIVVMVIIFGILTPNNVFFRVDTLFTIGLNASQMMVLAVGVSYLLAAGEIDLSIGTNLILSSVLAAKVIKLVAGTPEQAMRGEFPNLGWAVVAGIVVAVGSGAFFGFINGLVITRLKINSFITTLGMMMVYWGTSLVLTSGASEVGIPRALQLGFGHKKLFDLVPVPLLVAIAISFVLWFIMSTTRFGMHTCAIGSSQIAARRSGVEVDKHRIKLFMLLGALAGTAGLFDLTRFATTNPQGHQTDGLLAITAAVMGGTSMWGGIASIGGSMLGTLIPVILQTGLVIMRVGAFYQLIGTGIFLIIAVYLDQRRRGRDSEA